MAKIDVQSIRNRKQALKYASQQGFQVHEGGNHTLIVSDKGKCAIPRHNGDFCTGTRWAIVKTLALMCFLLSPCILMFIVAAIKA